MFTRKLIFIKGHQWWLNGSYNKITRSKFREVGAEDQGQSGSGWIRTWRHSRTRWGCRCCRRAWWSVQHLQTSLRTEMPFPSFLKWKRRIPKLRLREWRLHRDTCWEATASSEQKPRERGNEKTNILTNKHKFGKISKSFYTFEVTARVQTL